MFDEIASYCRFLLKNYPNAQSCQDYLDSRLSRESQEKFNIGYFPDNENLKVLTNLISEEILIEKKLLFQKEIDDILSYRNPKFVYFEYHPIIIPFRDQYGKTVALVGRTLLSEDDRKSLNIVKYKNTTPFNKGNYLFGLYENKLNILKQDSVYLVEGQFDAIKATECGLNNVVALGTSSMTAYQLSVILRYTNNIFLLLDNDEAGEKGRVSIIKKYNEYANFTNLYLPENYKDISSYLEENSFDSLYLNIKN